jgi:hypothetical protein
MNIFQLGHFKIVIAHSVKCEPIKQLPSDILSMELASLYVL